MCLTCAILAGRLFDCTLYQIGPAEREMPRYGHSTLRGVSLSGRPSHCCSTKLPLMHVAEPLPLVRGIHSSEASDWPRAQRVQCGLAQGPQNWPVAMTSSGRSGPGDSRGSTAPKQTSWCRRFRHVQDVLRLGPDSGSAPLLAIEQIAV